MQSLRFKSISHLQEFEVISILNVVTQQDGIVNEKIIQKQNDEKGKRNTLITEKRIQQFQDQPFREGSVAKFISSNPQNSQKVSQQNTRLRFQKIALEGLVKKLQEQLNRKDELIRALRIQLNVKGLSGGQGLRNTIGSYKY